MTSFVSYGGVVSEPTEGARVALRVGLQGGEWRRAKGEDDFYSEDMASLRGQRLDNDEQNARIVRPFSFRLTVTPPPDLAKR